MRSSWARIVLRPIGILVRGNLEWQFGVDNSETGQYFTPLYYIRYRRGIAGTGLVVAELEDSPLRVAVRSLSSDVLETVDESFDSDMGQTELCTL